MYINFQEKGGTGKEFIEKYVELDFEVGETTRQNFNTFYKRLKDHPSSGPGAIEESAASFNVARETGVTTEQESATNTPVMNLSLRKMKSQFPQRKRKRGDRRGKVLRPYSCMEWITINSRMMYE